MIPFVRTVSEAASVIDILAENGLKRGEAGLKVIMMCELPSNALLADKFLAYFDGFSIGSNDMTQLTLGLDRDSGLVAASFDERDEAVKALLSMAIKACHKAGKYVGICGQGPSDHKDISTSLAFGRRVMVPLVLRYMREHPGVGIDLSFDDRYVNLVEQGIDSLSLNPDTVIDTWLYLAEHLGTPKA